MQLLRKQKLVTGLGVAVLVLILANSLFFFLRLDLTSGQSYSISDTTRKILKNAKAPIQITYYLSGKLKAQYPSFQAIEDILVEYGRASSGNAAVAVINPEGREAELALDTKGIQPTNLNVADRTQVSQALVYSGIVINYLDQSRSIPFIQNAGELEYDLDAAIKQLDRKKDLTLGILSGSTGSGQGGQPEINHSYQIIRQEFQKSYKVSDVSVGTDIPAEIDVLFVFNPETLDRASLTRIDQFIMAGKGVLIGTDPVTINLQYGLRAMPSQDNGIFAALETYGIKVEKSLIADEYNRQFPITRQAGKMQYQQMVPYPFWLATSPEDANRTSPITNRFNGADFFWASPLALKDGFKGEILVSSSPRSVVLKDQFDIAPEKAQAFLAMSQDERKPRPLVILRTGHFDTAFSGDKPALTTTENGRLIVAGNSDFASDLIQYTNSAQNLDFLKNLLEWLGNDEDLMKLRNRDIGTPPLSAFKSPEVRQAFAGAAWALGVVIVPLGIVVFGLVQAIRRRGLDKSKGVAP